MESKLENLIAQAIEEAQALNGTHAAEQILNKLIETKHWVGEHRAEINAKVKAATRGMRANERV